MTALLVAAAIACCPQDTKDRSDYPGCRTRACERRVRAKAHRRTVRRWKAEAAPYRAWLARVRACESGGNYRTNTGNGYYGAFQFDLGTWASVGGRGYPHTAEPAEQDYRAVRLLRARGTSPWPVCG